MAGNGEDEELPNLDDEEDGNESTVAMEALSFPSAVPSPISNPPPAAGRPPASARGPAAPASARVPAVPAPAPASARSPAPPPARPPGVPAPGAPRPAFAGAPPRPLGGKIGKSTVIGLAPPGARPAAGPTPPAASAASAAPLSPRAPAAAAAPPAPAPLPAPVPPPPDDDEPGEGATMATDPGAMAAYAKNYPLDPPSDPAPENEAATVTVPKDVLDRVRADPKAVLAEEKRNVPRIVHDEDAEGGDETKAVPREELLRPQLPHLVVGTDGAGFDATLAVPSSANPNESAAASIGASIGDALHQPPGHDPRNDGGFPNMQGFPPPPFGGGMPAQHQPSPSYMGPGPQMMAQAQTQPQAWSSSHMPAAPHAHGGMSPYGGGPMMQPQGAGAIPRGQVPTNWAPLQAPKATSKLSGQMILLLVVGFVCLAIFVTGVVLFMTTKF